MCDGRGSREGVEGVVEEQGGLEGGGAEEGEALDEGGAERPDIRKLKEGEGSEL
jgi:hypothetical protein